MCASGFWSHVCATAKCVVICLCASTRVTSSSCPVAIICFFLKGYEPPSLNSGPSLLVPLFWKIYDREKLGRTDGSKTDHDCTPELQPISQSVSSGSGAHDGTICFRGFGPRSHKCMFPSPILEYCIFKVVGHRESVTPPAARRAVPEIINCTALMVDRSVQNLNSHA